MHNILIREMLLQILHAIETIEQRFEPVDSIDFLTDTAQGQEKLDSLCMLFIAIGESLKKIDKLTENQLLPKYKGIDWKAIKGMRDVLSHHYFDINAEAIYNACREDLPSLKQTINIMIQEL